MKKFDPFAPGVPYPSAEDMPTPPGMVKMVTHDGREDILPFLHDVTLASHEGCIYEAWYNSTSAEICGSSLIRGRYSKDRGTTWSEPFRIVGEMGQAEEHFVPADFLEHEGRLYALITTMSGKNMTVDLQLYGLTEDPMAPWEKIAKVSEGFICNTTPQLMDNGSYIVGAWMPKKEQDPAFPVALISQGKDIAKPWRIVFLYDPLHPQAPRIRCAEISIVAQGNKLTAYVRNDEGPSYVFTSADFGENWSEPMENTLPIGNSKIFAGILSDGRPYLVYNEERGYFVRTLLVLAVADRETGKFNRVYKLFEGHDDALDRGRTWFYPCACEQDGELYIAATLQETTDIRSAVMARMPIASL